MMPYIQGDSSSVPEQYEAYFSIVDSVYLEKGKKGFLTIDETFVQKGNAQRAQRAKFGRALHTEAGLRGALYCWGHPYGWGRSHNVILERNVRVLLANNIDDSCAVWDTEHFDTSEDGDIGDKAFMYPYSDAIMLKNGEVHDIGILTPHESIPVKEDSNRQFLRVVGEGVYGREPYFTVNPLMD